MIVKPTASGIMRVSPSSYMLLQLIILLSKCYFFCLNLVLYQITFIFCVLQDVENTKNSQLSHYPIEGSHFIK